MLLNITQKEIKALKTVIRFYLKQKGMTITSDPISSLLSKIESIKQIEKEVSLRYDKDYPPVKCPCCGVKKHRDIPCSNCHN